MNDKILYFLDSESVSSDIIEKIRNEKNSNILCLNHIIKNYFQKIKIDTISDKEILQESDYVSIDKITYDVSNNWCRNNKIENDLIFKGINLGETIQNELFQNTLKYIERIFLVQKTLEKIQPTRVFTTSGNKILDSIKQKICNDKNIQVEILKNTYVRSQENKFDKVNF